MELGHYRKETSERSDARNWAKQLLESRTPLHYDGIEGCSQDQRDEVTHLMERARVDMQGDGLPDEAAVLRDITRLEGEETLRRKVRFAQCLGRPLTYVVYSMERDRVLVYALKDGAAIRLQRDFPTIQAFSGWLGEIKGWISRKAYREDGLPEFDRALRACGTPWPANIDCFVSTADGRPCAILEFQSTEDTPVHDHRNNDWFLCRSVQYNDIRRWTTQEILRVQSGLRYFIITWSTKEKAFKLKQVERITIPDLRPADQQFSDRYRQALSAHVRQRDDPARFEAVARHFPSYNLFRASGTTRHVRHHPPLDRERRTFPSIYYHWVEYVENQPDRLIQLAQRFIP